MPGLSPQGFLPTGWDSICWNDSCTHLFSGSEDVKLQVCLACKTARYCSRSCQKVGWAQHKQQCAQVQRLHQTSKRSIRAQDSFRIFPPFADNEFGLLCSASGVLNEPRWRFMRLSQVSDWMMNNGLDLMSKSFWRGLSDRPEAKSTLDSI